MQSLPKIEFIIDKIAKTLPLHAKKLRKRSSEINPVHYPMIHSYYLRYEAALKQMGKDLSFGIDSYCKLVKDMVYYRQRFLKEGKYANQSFKEVYETVYNNPGTMEYHMHGLTLAQFLWIDQYERYVFFLDTIPKLKPHAHSFLDLGAGHGIYLDAIMEQYPRIDASVIDISPTSLALCKRMVTNPCIKYFEKDIMLFEEDKKYEIISIAEVIEHLEDPVAILRKAAKLLDENGIIFLSTPVNSPMIDHIYLFSSLNEITALIAESGFNVIAQTFKSSEDTDLTRSMELKVPVMYAAVLKRS